MTFEVLYQRIYKKRVINEYMTLENCDNVDEAQFIFDTLSKGKYPKAKIKITYFVRIDSKHNEN